MRIHTAAELREIDRRAVQKLGLPTLVLMENAGRAVASAAREAARQEGARVFVVCGKGNNGGDGFVAARHLRAAGLSSVLVSMASLGELKGDALLNANAALACGVPLVDSISDARSGDVVVDALFGTGLARAPAGRALELIRDLNAARVRGALVIAIDLPSGVDADQPHPPGEAVRADVTVTLHALKPALVQFPSRALCGDVRVGDLGIPNDDGPGPRRRWIDRELARSMLPPRATDAHKGTSGHVLVVAGSPGKSGASMMASHAALRTGAGLVTLASAAEVIDRVLPAMPEVMGHPLPSFTGDALLEALEGKDVLVIGPGLARDDSTATVLVELLRHVPLPAVLDADALNALAASPSALADLPGALARPILTPHPAELARLLQTTTAAVQADRFAAATEAARRFNAYVVLKGAGTVVAHPDGSLDVNSSGTPAMATAGAGDVLSGIIGALLAQGLAPAKAASLGVFAHGRAGELASHGRDRGLVAMEIADAVPAALAELL